MNVYYNRRNRGEMVKYSIEISDFDEEIIGPRLTEELMRIVNGLELSLVISYKNWKEIKTKKINQKKSK